jgi:mono/diheme cytochrome c family protein
MQKSFGPGAAAALGVVLSVMAVSGAGQPAVQSAPATAPTFARDVAPILYESCVTCHRPGEVAPMPLITFNEVRPWARGIAKAVADGVMPPWHAVGEDGAFENERKLTAAERDVIARWVAAGAPEGDPSDTPAPPSFVDGWQIGTPDVVLEMQEPYAVPSRGTIEYEYFYIPTNFTETKWLQAIEVRPGDRGVVHHVLVYYVAPPEGAAGTPALRLIPEHNRLPRPQRERGIAEHPRRRVPGQQTRLLATYAPGTNPQTFRPGTALRLAPGGTIELQMHYTTNGTGATDRTTVGMIFAKEPPQHEVRAAQFLNASFTIPAGAEEHRVDTEVAFVQDSTVWGVFPHTHVRGTRWEYVLALPDGTTRSLLSVPNYDFNWQTYYMFKEPLQVPAGARILSSAWYDNSARNRSNPDPKVDVTWGDQTWEEMQYTGLLYSVGPP